MKKLFYIIASLIGMSITTPILAAQSLRVGDKAVVRYTRRRGSTTEWVKGAKVKILDEHPGMVMDDGTVTDYTVIMENEDTAFPLADQLMPANDR